MKQKFGIYNSMFLGLMFVAVIIVGSLATLFVRNVVAKSSKDSLLTRANTIAQFVDPKAIKEFTGSDLDYENPEFTKLKKQFEMAREQNPDTRFIYALGMKDDTVFFYLDSEPSDSEDYSAPGDVYFEASPELKQAFYTKQPFLESFYEDRWGTWVSALSPVIDPNTNDVVALVGLDIAASTYNNSVWLAAMIPALATLLLLSFLIAYWYVRRKEIKHLLLNAEMVSLASHEIRSPLNGISWAAQSLLKSTTIKASKKQTDMVTLIRNSSENMLRIVNDLLDLYAMNGAKNSNGWEKFDLAGLVAESVLGFELGARRRKVTMEFSAQTGQALVVGDKAKIRRVINNLVSNALKYSRDKGSVKVVLKKTGEDYVCSVADQGIGVPASDQDKIFHGFYRAANAKVSAANGTGLGLYYARQIIESHGGEVWLKSQENRGSTFFVSLPSNRQ